MPCEEIKLTRTKNIKTNICFVFVLLVLVLISVFLADNIVSIIEIKKQIDAINTSTPVNNFVTSSVPVESATTSTLSVPQINNSQAYYNIATDPFFGNDLINLNKTNLHLDTNVTALTFDPVYDFKYQKTCDKSGCGFILDDSQSCLANNCLSQQAGEIYYKNKKINLPSELNNKKITNVNFSLLKTKWVIGIVVSENEEERGYVYLFDGSNLTPLITNNTTWQIKTQYKKLGGSISAGGSDNQFIIFYSGYEGIAYFYNNGTWQNISQYLGLRVLSGGFKAKVISDGTGKSTNWYVCSNSANKAKLIKLWQNNTASIQGSIDLSDVVKGSSAFCFYNNNQEINIVRNLSGVESLYTFKDNGFDNSHPYYYQSVNLSNLANKKMFSVALNSYSINAQPDSYSLFISADGQNWQPNKSGEVVLNNDSNLNTFYLKAEFKTGESNYSPWFDGINSIAYKAVD